MEEYKTVAKIIPLIGVRKVIAERMSESLRKSPQASATLKIDVSKLIELYEALNVSANKVSFTALFVKIAAKALEENPLLNSSLQDGSIYIYSSINIGVAVAGEGSLYVPVVKNVEKKSLIEVSKEIRSFIAKANNRELTYNDLTGGTFTLSNMGMYDVDIMTPIINMPEAAILAVGAIRKEVTIDQTDNIRIVPMANFSLTIDHAVLDGVPATKFLESLKRIIASPQDNLDLGTEL